MTSGSSSRRRAPAAPGRPRAATCRSPARRPAGRACRSARPAVRARELLDEAPLPGLELERLSGRRPLHVREHRREEPRHRQGELLAARSPALSAALRASRAPFPATSFSYSRSSARSTVSFVSSCQRRWISRSRSGPTSGPASKPPCRLARKLRSRTRSCRLFAGLATTAPHSAPLDETGADLACGRGAICSKKNGLFAGIICAHVLLHGNESRA